VAERTPLIQLKLIRGRKNKISELTAMMKIWYFSISSFRYPSFD
jgi:hypothetical protein